LKSENKLVEPNHLRCPRVCTGKEKNALNNRVEQLEKQLQEEKEKSIGNLLPPARVLLPQPPTKEKDQMAIQLEQKSGWLYKKGGMMSAAYQIRYFVLQNSSSSSFN